MEFIFNVLVIQLILLITLVNSFFITDLKYVTKKVKKSVVIKDKTQLWDMGIIPYEVENVFNKTERRLIALGMLIWEESTCIKFIERNPIYHPDYVVFTKLDCGCCFIENNPRNRGRTELSLNDGCNELPIILHELGHLLGFYHEHEHPDRDQHIRIYEHNVERGYRQEFGKFLPDEVDTLGPYDLRSVMHYPKNAFARYKFLETIEPIDWINGTKPRIGNKDRLSQGDISSANSLYQCSNCSKTLHNNRGFILSPNFSTDTPSSFLICDWKIPVANGSKVAFKIWNLNIPKSPNCSKDFLEVRKGFSENGQLLGRYCGNHTNILIIDEDMLVKYVRTQKSNDFEGFLAGYFKICGGEKFILSNSSITIQSPNYPGDYESKSECIWEFKTPINHLTTIRFDYFNIEPSDNCTFDRVIIETFDSNAEFFEPFCGERSPWEITIKGNQFIFAFLSDDDYESSGFSATITTVPIIN